MQTEAWARNQAVILERFRMSLRRIGLVALLSVFFFLGACSEDCAPTQTAAAPTVSASDSPFVATATVKELMDATVEPAADGLWEAVAITFTRTAVNEHRPRTDEEWKAVRRHAVTLIEATNLIVMNNRHAAPPETPPGEGELTPAEIDQRISATRPAFVQFARGLRATAVKALDAIDKQDAEALLQAGSDIDEACEACHLTYWYPNQRAPIT